MAATAPFCNVTVFAPAPNPSAPSGLRIIPPNATLQQAIQIINDNNSPKTQDAEFARQLARDIARPVGPKTGGASVKPSQVRQAAQKEISKLDFIESSVVRKRVKVSNPEDREQYVIDSRVVAMVMTDRRTGAKWTFKDPKAEDPAG